jgi:hypothetical protein
MMNKYVSFLSLFFCSNLLLGAVNAQAAKKFDITVVNGTRSAISLAQATWSLGDYAPVDYKIPEHFTGAFRVTVPGEIKGSLAFTYAIANAACRFRADWGTVPGRGWLIGTPEPFETVRGQSVGQFGAVCNASIVRNDADDGFTLNVSIK